MVTETIRRKKFAVENIWKEKQMMLMGIKADWLQYTTNMKSNITIDLGYGNTPYRVPNTI